MQILAGCDIGYIVVLRSRARCGMKDLNLLIGISTLSHMGFCFPGHCQLQLDRLTGASVIMDRDGWLSQP